MQWWLVPTCKMKYARRKKNEHAKAWTWNLMSYIAKMPKNKHDRRLCQMVINSCLAGLQSIGYPVLIGNFFSNQDLFYLTHIHDNQANLTSHSIVCLLIFVYFESLQVLRGHIHLRHGTIFRDVRCWKDLIKEFELNVRSVCIKNPST